MNTEFIKGDIVRLKHLEKVQISPIYGSDSLNVFKISKIEDDRVKLEYVDETVPLLEIEAVPINGVDDKSVYYDPIIAASIIAPGQPIPVHKRDYSYFIESFKRITEDGKTFYEIMIEEQGCKFVHEVQHFLRNRYHRDELKINYY